MNFPGTGIDAPRWAVGVALLAGTISMAGLADYALTNAGYSALGAFVWAVSYAGVFLIIWAVWLRHIDLQGPASG